MAFWLPLQAGAALAVSLNLGAEPHPAHAQALAESGHDHGAAQSHAAHLDGQAGATHDGHHHGFKVGSCERCGLCQFVHGGVMLSNAAGVPAVVAPQVFEPLGAERFSAHIPEPLQRPPLPSA